MFQVDWIRLFVLAIALAAVDIITRELSSLFSTGMGCLGLLDAVVNMTAEDTTGKGIGRTSELGIRMLHDGNLATQMPPKHCSNGLAHTPTLSVYSASHHVKLLTYLERCCFSWGVVVVSWDSSLTFRVRRRQITNYRVIFRCWKPVERSDGGLRCCTLNPFWP